MEARDGGDLSCRQPVGELRQRLHRILGRRPALERAIQGVEHAEAEDALLAAADAGRAARIAAGNDAIWVLERRAALRLVA